MTRLFSLLSGKIQSEKCPVNATLICLGHDYFIGFLFFLPVGEYSKHIETGAERQFHEDHRIERRMQFVDDRRFWLITILCTNNVRDEDFTIWKFWKLLKVRKLRRTFKIRIQMLNGQSIFSFMLLTLCIVKRVQKPLMYNSCLCDSKQAAFFRWPTIKPVEELTNNVGMWFHNAVVTYFMFGCDCDIDINERFITTKTQKNIIKSE